MTDSEAVSPLMEALRQSRRDHERIAEKIHDEFVQVRDDLTASIQDLRLDFIELSESIHDLRTEETVEAAWNSGYNILGKASEVAHTVTFESKEDERHLSRQIVDAMTEAYDIGRNFRPTIRQRLGSLFRRNP